MMGIGVDELVLIGLICVLPVIAGLVGIGALLYLIWYKTRTKNSSSSSENEP